ncbi:MAG: molybdopterin converting factor subunit 1 [Caldilineaceae bacterium]|nr:molybdopterin converting factor subunit 1 [Caldilineaceae bacterium]
MAVTVKLFATLREQAGWAERKMSVPDGTTLGDLMRILGEATPNLKLVGRPVYAAINQSYTQMAQALHEGDVVAIFPPVSGGRGEQTMSERKRFEITTAPLSLDDVAARVSDPRYGAITTFAGVVRGETVTAEGERGTDFLHYEAYAEMAESMMAQIGDEIQTKWPKVGAVSILHRIGRLEIGEPSVLIAVATPHRGDGCFEACRYAIERLKAVVPIWKQENWADGQVWVEGPRQPDLTLDAPEFEADATGNI